MIDCTLGNRAAPEQGDKGSYAAGDTEDDRDMDFIDLTHPVQRRVLLDFISPYELLDRTTTTAALDKDEQVREGEEARDPLSHFFFGVYHGSLLHQSSKDQQLLHHKLHSSTTLGDFLSKSNDHQVRSGDDCSDFFSFHQTDTYTRVIRLGDDYQADIPVMMSSASCISDSHSAPAMKRSSRSASTINDGVIWHSSSFSEDAVQDFLQLCDRRRRLLSLRVGMVVVVDLETVAGDSTRAYRLCCILDIICSEVDQSEDSLVVFDGYDVRAVDPSLCLSINQCESYVISPFSLLLIPFRSGPSPSAPALGAWRVKRRRCCCYSRGTKDWSARLVTCLSSLFHP